MSMWRWIAIGVFSLAALGCGDSTESARVAPETTAEAAESVVAEEIATTREAVAEKPSPAPGTRDVAGLTLEVLQDGSISLTGADRWGNPLDTTYANLEYLTNAVQVLQRSMTDEQASALAALVEELGGSPASAIGDEEAAP